MKNYRISRIGTSFFAVLAVFSVTVCLFVCVFLWFGRAEERIDPQREYYFLVSDCEETTAGAVAGQVYLQGGAGYLAEVDGQSLVVLAGYFRLTDAERVQTSTAEKGTNTRILTLSAAPFLLRGERASQKGRIEANLATAETCARMLYEAANGLERSEYSQDEARAAVRGVTAALKGLKTENEESEGRAVFSLWNATLDRMSRRSADLAEELLFAKDLRYLQVELLFAIVEGETYFA